MEIICCGFLILRLGWRNLGFRCNFTAGGGKATHPLNVTAETPRFPWLTLSLCRKTQAKHHLWWLRQIFHPEFTGEEKSSPLVSLLPWVETLTPPKNIQTQHLFLGFTFWTHKKTFLFWVYYLRLWFPCSLHPFSSFLSFPPSERTCVWFCCFFQLHWIQIPIFWCILATF